MVCGWPSCYHRYGRLTQAGELPAGASDGSLALEAFPNAANRSGPADRTSCYPEQLVTTIVIGVDGTPAATRASEVGVRLAASMDAHVLFVHFSRLADELFEEIPRMGRARSAWRRPIQFFAQRFPPPAAQGVTAELMVQDEHGASMIAANLAGVAEGVDAELVVVGNRGRSEVAEIVLGSVAHELLRLSTRPVVVVHAGTQKPAWQRDARHGGERRWMRDSSRHPAKRRGDTTSVGPSS